MEVSTDSGCKYDTLTILFLYCVLEEPWCKMTKRIHRNDLLLVCPLGKWANISCWLGVGEIGSG